MLESQPFYFGTYINIPRNKDKTGVGDHFEAYVRDRFGGSVCSANVSKALQELLGSALEHYSETVNVTAEEFEDADPLDRVDKLAARFMTELVNVDMTHAEAAIESYDAAIAFLKERDYQNDTEDRPEEEEKEEKPFAEVRTLLPDNGTALYVNGIRVVDSNSRCFEDGLRTGLYWSKTSLTRAAEIINGKSYDV